LNGDFAPLEHVLRSPHSINDTVSGFEPLLYDIRRNDNRISDLDESIVDLFDGIAGIDYRIGQYHGGFLQNVQILVDEAVVAIIHLPTVIMLLIQEQ